METWFYLCLFLAVVFVKVTESERNEDPTAYRDDAIIYIYIYIK